MSDNCISYQYNKIEYLIPSPIILNTTLCETYDRTKLFIISFSRLLIWSLFYSLVKDNKYLKDNKYVINGLIVYITINVIYLLYVMFSNNIIKETDIIVYNNPIRHLI